MYKRFSIQKLRQQGFSLLLICWALMVASCSNTKYLAQNQALLISNEIRLKGENLTKNERENIRNDLSSSSILLQAPNYKTLRIARIGLWLYNHVDTTGKGNRLLSWLINKNWLKPPVIYDSNQTHKTVENMLDYLINQGYFRATVNDQVHIRKQKARVTYLVNTGKNFLINQISYRISDTAIRKIVLADTSLSLLHKGIPYKTDLLINERERIARLLNDHGYYHFSTDDILFVVDTINTSLLKTTTNPFESIFNVFSASRSREKPTLNIEVVINQPEDSSDFHQYYIRKINVFPDLPLNINSIDTNQFYKIPERYFTIFTRRNLFRPRVFMRALYFRPGDLYSRTAYEQTVRQLNSLNQWKFVNVQFHELQVNDTGWLDANIYLIPEKRQEVGISLEGTTGSDYELGSSIGLSYMNRNIHRAANILTVSLKGGVELDSALNIYAQEMSGQINLNFPRFIVPFDLRRLSRFANAKTNLNTGFDYMNRIDFYKFQNYYASFGYTWNETQTKSWIVKPFVLAYNKYSNFSPAFQQELDSNQFLRNSFQSVFLEGENISFIYNNQLSANQRQFNYFRIDLDESGLLLEGIDGMLKLLSRNQTDFTRLTTLRYSQYVKLTAEYKHFYNWSHATLVSRIMGGVAVPYGGSQAVPYIKQFFAGGPNSMRAWHLRTLGPGSYKYQASSNLVFVDQTGEMKIEGNLEYRFDILQLFGGVSFLKGALFTDVGNIWNLRSDPNKPGAVFRLNKLYQQIAVGSGFGLRLDFNYFLLRLDMATPLKDPSVSAHDGWFPNGFRPFNLKWLGKNLVFSFAVGYPF
ncbi:MAG: BamA/TamA family outer membrane protein [Thermoflavifilum sp.]|nr:BamA/TamA family outer membrane protein [Thermoflavifilum sp.]